VNILIVKLSAIGDVVHTLPSLAALRKLYPRAHITWVIEEAAADLIKNHPLLDCVIISRRQGWVRDLKKGRIEALGEVRHFLKELRSRQYDLVIDFHGLLKSSLLVFLTAAPRKLGFDSWQELSGLFLTEKVPEVLEKHAVYRYLDLVRHLARENLLLPGSDVNEQTFSGSGNGDIEFPLPRDEAVERRVAGLLAEKGLTSGGFVAINPVALWETKLWEDRNFALLADMLIGQYGMPVLFTGREKREIDGIRALMTREAVNLAGETSLTELACLYRQSALLVTTDTGPMHIAAAVGTPVVALFGPTDPSRTGPFGQRHRVIRAELPCSPCLRKKCTHRECMRRISPEEVLLAVGDVLRNKSA